jgi:8-oxo-dGTP pyrophosphatase MutT (NUDIX family)
VPNLRSAFIEVYVFRRTGRRAEFLCLRRGRVSYLPGVWQPVTGKRRKGETSRAAAAREVREETGLSPRRWWALENPTVYYDARWDEVLALPLFAAEVSPGDAVRLSREHDRWAFLPAREAGRRFLWEAQRRALEDVRRQVLQGGPLAETLELPLAAKRAARRVTPAPPVERRAPGRTHAGARRPRPA